MSDYNKFNKGKKSKEVSWQKCQLCVAGNLGKTLFLVSLSSGSYKMTSSNRCLDVYVNIYLSLKSIIKYASYLNPYKMMSPNVAQ